MNPSWYLPLGVLVMGLLAVVIGNLLEREHKRRHGKK